MSALIFNIKGKNEGRYLKKISSCGKVTSPAVISFFSVQLCILFSNYKARILIADGNVTYQPAITGGRGELSTHSLRRITVRALTCNTTINYSCHKMSYIINYH